MEVVDRLPGAQAPTQLKCRQEQRNGSRTLMEGLHFTPALQLSCTHSSRYFPRVVLENGDWQGVRVWSVFGAFVQLLGHHDLLTFLVSTQDD